MLRIKTKDQGKRFKVKGSRNKGQGKRDKVNTILNFDAFVKSRISPPLVGGDKGEGDITT